MISPYVKRLRLAMELRQLRAEADLTQAQLAKMIGKGRMDLSRLESGHTSDQADVLSILAELHIEGERWTQIATIAREASQQGWWANVKNIGERQALIADLEAGAARIRTYEQTFPPGLLQIPEFVHALTSAETPLPVPGTVEGILAGRVGRQRMLNRPGGPALEVIIDEAAILRLAAPPAVVKKQLYSLAETISETKQNVILRVLPVRARIKGYTVPQGAFTVYDYPDAGDPQIVAVDTVTSDLMLTDETQVKPYEKLYESLSEAVLPPEESAELLTSSADELDDD